MPHQMRLRAFDSTDKLLYEQYIPINDWYEDLHFLLDDEDSKRVYYRVRSVVGEEINTDGVIVAGFRNLYSEQGGLVVCSVWEDGSWFDERLDMPSAKED